MSTLCTLTAEIHTFHFFREHHLWARAAQA